MSGTTRETRPTAAGHDLSRIPTHAAGKRGSPGEKIVGGIGDASVFEYAPTGSTSAPAPGVSPPPAAGGGAAAAPAKKAGVDSFSVKWTKNAAASPTVAKLRLDYKATFKDDATHDPALADFRQSVYTKYKFTDGPRKGETGDTSPMHDDNYSRGDDTAGNPRNGTKFESNDNPGFASVSANDELEYEFHAEQTIIDTSDGNKVIAKKGPHKGTIKGKGARVYGGVPANL